MSDIKLNTTNGSVTLKPEDGSGNVDVTIPRAGVGKVLQVVQWKADSTNLTSSLLATTSTSFADVMSISITAKSNNSKFLITTSLTSYNSSSQRGSLRLLRNNSVQIDYSKYTPYDSGGIFTTHSFVTLDSPNASKDDSILYAIQGRSDNGAMVNLGYFNGANGPNASITITEIAN